MKKIFSNNFFYCFSRITRYETIIQIFQIFRFFDIQKYFWQFFSIAKTEIFQNGFQKREKFEKFEKMNFIFNGTRILNYRLHAQPVLGKAFCHFPVSVKHSRFKCI